MNANPNSNIIPFPGQPNLLDVFQLRVELLLMPVPVWRRILVPARMNFWELHVALQDALGWEDCHLHQFTVDNPGDGRRRCFGIPDESGFHGVHAIEPGWEHGIAAYLRVSGHALLYTYDFGDDWQHEVVLEQILAPEESRELPSCLAGAGLCPPEDSGGPAMCESLPGEITAGEFVPQDVVFDNPRLRWQRAFGKD